MTDEPTEAERTVLHSFVQTVHDMTKVSQTHVRRETLADCLVAVAANILREMHGAPIAAERLRQTADLIELTHPAARH